MDSAIRKALTWTVFGIGILMAGFTALDLGSGVASTALWIGLFAWLVVSGIALSILLADRKNDPAATEDTEL
ncbi:hypothetical protein U6G28_08430 [Actinomycetaceae bacterium MB13-C1-2]|nr:hypothetical protein U6G28_08430 [Actinomycetaceae bacterium MB13-C1-2]